MRSASSSSSSSQLMASGWYTDAVRASLRLIDQQHRDAVIDTKLRRTDRADQHLALAALLGAQRRMIGARAGEQLEQTSGQRHRDSLVSAADDREHLVAGRSH